MDWESEEPEKRLLIVSNPCFEYWLLYNFIDKNPDSKTSGETIETLRTHLPNYNKGLDRRKFTRDSIILASKRCKNYDITKDFLKETGSGSDMYKLIDLLLDLEKKKVWIKN